MIPPVSAYEITRAGRFTARLYNRVPRSPPAICDYVALGFLLDR